MTILPLITAAAVVIYACRLAGFSLNLSETAPYRDQFLRFVPRAVLAALITLSVMCEPEQMGMKGAVLLVVGVVLLGMRRFRAA